MEAFTVSAQELYMEQQEAPSWQLQPLESMLTPLDAVFAEYDGLSMSTDTETPLHEASNQYFNTDLAAPGAVERSTPPAEALRSSLHVDYAETSSVPVSATPAASSESDSGCDEEPPSAATAKSSTKVNAKARGRRGQSQSCTAAKRCRTATDFQTMTMSGVLQPFDVIKNYGMGGSAMSLQQLNAKIKGSCQML